MGIIHTTSDSHRTGYTGSDYKSMPGSISSSSSLIVMFFGSAIFRQSKLQPSAAAHACGAEYPAVNLGDKEALCRHKLMRDVGSPIGGPATVNGDKTPAIA